MEPVQPVVLTHGALRLEPLALAHEAGLRAAASDGALWRLRVTQVPDPEGVRSYIDKQLAHQAAGHRLPFAVLWHGEVVGHTCFHDIVPAAERLEIGATWYAQSHQRTALNTTAKLTLMTHAFETLGAAVVGWRTDALNLVSQAAIERLGARKDGVLRHHSPRHDGTVRDTVMYSLLRDEWPEVKLRLQQRLQVSAS